MYSFVVNALRELSVVLISKGNCVLYKWRLYALAWVGANTFRAGTDIPTSDTMKDVSFLFGLAGFQPLLGAGMLLLSML